MTMTPTEFARCAGITPDACANQQVQQLATYALTRLKEEVEEWTMLKGVCDKYAEVCNKLQRDLTAKGQTIISLAEVNSHQKGKIEMLTETNNTLGMDLVGCKQRIKTLVAQLHHFDQTLSMEKAKNEQFKVSQGVSKQTFQAFYKKEDSPVAVQRPEDSPEMLEQVQAALSAAFAAGVSYGKLSK